jgi:hypothetical protein
VKNNELTKEEKINAIKSIIEVIQDIGFGRGNGYGALEGISVALAGTGLNNPVGESLNNIASAINDHAKAIDNFSKAIIEFSNKFK